MTGFHDWRALLDAVRQLKALRKLVMHSCFDRHCGVNDTTEQLEFLEFLTSSGELGPVDVKQRIEMDKIVEDLVIDLQFHRPADVKMISQWTVARIRLRSGDDEKSRFPIRHCFHVRVSLKPAFTLLVPVLHSRATNTGLKLAHPRNHP